MYLISDDPRVEVGWYAKGESFLVLADDYRYEHESPVAALDDVARLMGLPRVSSVWLYRIVNDRDGVRLPKPATRQHTAPGSTGHYAPDPVAA